MKYLLAFFENQLMPLLVSFADNRYIRAVRDAFITYTLPMIIAGSLFLILSFPPIPPNSEYPFFQAIQHWAVTYRPVLIIPFTFSFGFMAVWVVFGTAASLAEHYDLPGIRAGLTAVAALFILSVPISITSNLSNIPLGFIIDNLSGKGLFVAIFTAFFTVETTRYLYKHNLILRLPQGVPPAVSRSFESLVPTALVLSMAWLVECYVTTTFSHPETGQFMTLPALVMHFFEPLVQATDTYPAALIQILLMMSLWSVGIHGMNLVSAAAYPFWSTNLAENVAAAAGGAPLPHIVTEPFFHVYAHLGGSGATLPLVLFLLRSRSSQLRQVGKFSMIPALFNINEPIIFGIPIAFNPLMSIPFILVPAVIVSINYAAMSIGLVPKPLLQFPLTMPILLGGFLSAQHWSGAALQLFDLIVSGIIYYPFFKLWEKTLTQKNNTDQ